jgi:hypothetical protein
VALSASVAERATPLSARVSSSEIKTKRSRTEHKDLDRNERRAACGILTISLSPNYRGELLDADKLWLFKETIRSNAKKLVLNQG